jgi:type I restriction-modification system DNA methylase subunit
MLDPRLALVQEKLTELENDRSLAAAQQVVRAVVGLFVPDNNALRFKLFLDGDNKITANSNWFFHDGTNTDRLATYTVDLPNDFPFDVKVFGVTKPSRQTISWVVGLTPNFEDEPFNSKFNVGIDFVIPKSLDRVVVALSSNYVVRTLELRGVLTSTFLDILSSWTKISNFENKKEVHRVLWESFDLHPINKKFYEEISQRFVSLRQHIEATNALDHTLAAQFSNRLIGRVIFTWFLDKKGLIEPSLGYFASEVFDDDTNYYRQKLEPLFFEVLNTPVSERQFEDLGTPYLNGGLFEPKLSDLQKNPKLTFPKNYFDDFFKFLRSYNFTTDESTTEFQQVAIDPEMLGRIFENLLAEVSEETGEQARKAKGAFYTPREVVDFMCRESLKSYLRTELHAEDDLDRTLYQLIDATERDFQDQDHNWRRDLKKHHKSVIEALGALRTIDPACGSGAFPIGMLQLLVKVYSRLETRADPYKTKLSIIKESIFGIDIEPMAVEIARLRAWLSLIVEEDVKSKIEPLPNLDFNFACANSLIPLLPASVDLFNDPLFSEKLSEIRQDYFSAVGSVKKQKLRDKYYNAANSQTALLEDARTIQLKSFDPFRNSSPADFFDADQMFGHKEFNIVIGNPPYGAKLSSHEKSLFKEIYKIAKTENGVKGSPDSYAAFLEFGLSLLGSRGSMHYILPISVTSSDAMSKGHELLEAVCETLRFSSFAVRPKPIFENAMVNVSILLAEKTGKPNKEVFSTKLNRKSDRSTIAEILSSLKYQEVSRLKIRGRYPKISEDIETKILTKLQSIKSNLGSLKQENGAPIFYRAAGGRYFKVVTNYTTNSSAEKQIMVPNEFADLVGALLSSNLFFWYYQVFSDNLNLKNFEIESFPIPIDRVTAKDLLRAKEIYSLYLSDIESNAKVRQTAKYQHISEFKEYKIGKSIHIIDEIDDSFDELFGLDPLEIEFIKNYERQFRIEQEESPETD